MIIFTYDKTFDGLLSCVFFAYEQKKFPDFILSESDQKPLFVDEQYRIITEKEKSLRVWKALEKKLSKIAQNMMLSVWLSELPETEMLLFRYIRKNIDHPEGVEMNFGDDDVLRIKEIAQKVAKEAEQLRQFVRFQETADGIYFAPVSPRYDVLSLIVSHFQSRYAGQPWIIYDTNRNTGLYYDTRSVVEVSFSQKDLSDLRLGVLDEEKLSSDETFFQQMWKEYFKSTTIKERINLKLQRQHMPRRYWRYLTEMQ
ncbi:TIGR03915 family putative DNA repair protein [Petrimonas sulfuriphila]|jgi:probable DNA metabolism protein|uniref:TIGR03915 family putative DNA repair protein n=1 Tax=Petrimonas sulfuriphila TaxID=285070 RepID=UPI000E9AC558|nr:TIGR03915 family putative DNA repair protein [Petrimonas sp.]MDD4537292.1 TIGR03915 family putative DNA repair protein [Petrimonas sp.]HBF96069.1 DNA metabolism protein [Porphyromonadaceae bacterium]HBG80146.1 DNA metabolism protein [Porphyromonadaceae bacterium]